MSVFGNDFWSKTDDGTSKSPIKIRETHWGLIISDGRKKDCGGSFAETVLKLLAICTLFASIIPWVIETSPIGSGILMMQMSLSTAFLVTGFGVYAHAGRGFHQEVHIDGLESEVRLATRNSRGETTIRQSIPMMHIVSCFMRLTKSKKAPAELHLRLKSRNKTVPIASGQERVVVPVLEQIADLIKVTERHARY